MKRGWVICTLVGGLIIIPSLIATVAIAVATGEPCETADGPGTCSSDPKLLYGAVPLAIGGAMFGIGLWRWIATSSKERAARSPGSKDGGLMGTLEGWRRSEVESAMAQANLGRTGSAPPGSTMSAGGATTVDASSWKEPFLAGLEQARQLGNISDEEYEQAKRDAGL